jgi:serine/threonine protein kinase
MEPLRVGDPGQVGVYQLVSRLGDGGMGQVFLGLSPGGRPVAVKLIRPEFAADVEFRSRFAREVDAARRVGGFHTAPVVDADPYDNPPWMVTAYIAGPSLQAVVTDNGPLAPGTVSRLGAALTEGLAAIHRSGLVHRDLKPGNIIMADDGPRIIDFGIAQAVGATSLTTPGTVIGTYSFMSPEQVRADSATPESDVFALGCVLAYAATGRAPFEASNGAAIIYRILNEEPDLGDLPPGVLRDTLAACLAKDPERRPLPSDLLARFAAGLPSRSAPAAGQTLVADTPGERAPASDLVPSPGPVVQRPVGQRPVVGGPVVEGPVVEGPAVPDAVVPDAAAAEVAVPDKGVPDVVVPGVLAPGAEVHVEQVTAKRHENITIRQEANASPGSVVIQVAGNARIGDDT